MTLDAPVDDVQKRTLATAAYDAMRQAIIVGALAPGEQLRVRVLCDRFSVGLSPLREALSRLSSEGLVRQEDHRGFSVAPLGLGDLDGLVRARLWLNETGLRESIRHGDAAWEERVLLCFHRLSRTPRHSGADLLARNPAWEAAHAAFHASLIDACRSDWLIGFCQQLFEAAERYRHVARLAGSARPANEQEHRAIMEAAIARDADRASELLSAHFEKTAELVRKVLRREPAPAVRGRRPTTRR